MILQQYELQRQQQTMICWLEANRVKLGDRVTLKDSERPEEYWTVTQAFSKMDQANIKDDHLSKKWHDKDFHGRLKGLNIK